MQRLQHTAAIDSNDLLNKIEVIKNEIIRQFKNLNTELNNFQNDNNITFTKDIQLPNTSQNFINTNADVGILFENMPNLLTYYFNTYKQNIKNFAESIDVTQQ